MSEEGASDARASDAGVRRAHVRRAGPADADAIAALARDVQAAHHAARPDLFAADGGLPMAALRERLAGHAYRYLVAVDDAAIVGYACARESRTPASAFKHAAHVMELVELAVAASHRRRGVGDRLVAAVRAAALDAGAARVVLHVWEFNAGAVAFYERAGFGTASRWMAMELDAAHDAACASEAPGRVSGA